MTKGLRATSPVHVHVEDDTPVHVHVKKPPGILKSSSRTSVDERLAESKARSARSFGASNLRRTHVSRPTAHSKSRSPLSGPWVPAPGKTSRGTKLSWQGPSHRLEIHTPRDDDGAQSTMRVSDLDSDEEGRVTSHMNNYERKIDSLMSEVGSLKSEVELQKTLREVEKKDDMLETTHRVLEEQENELQEYKSELDVTERENRLLRRSMDRLRDDADLISSEKDALMKKLVEVELDGQAAAKQVSELRGALRRVREENRYSSADVQAMSKQKELLLEKLSDFETTNHTLRRLLREKHREESSGMRLAEQRDMLLKKLGESDNVVQQLRTETLDKDRMIGELRGQVDAQREENLAVTGLQSSLEQTRAHLQKQLRMKEADCNRMAVQIRGLESQVAQEKIEIDHLQELLQNAKEKAERDKEALKKATRVQKQRATRSEDALGQLNSQLLEKEAEVADLNAQMDQLRANMEKLSREKSQIVSENTSLKNRLIEVETTLQRIEDNSRSQIETMTARLHDKTSEASTLKLETERLKTTNATLEDKIAQGNADIAKLRADLRQNEAVMEEYRVQVNRSRREADEISIRLDEQEKETHRAQVTGEVELEKVKMRLQQRLQELEPLPELLKTTELRLRDANDRLLVYETKHTDNTKLITELTVKVESLTHECDVLRGLVSKLEKDKSALEEKSWDKNIVIKRAEHQSEQLEKMRERVHVLEDENRLLAAKLENSDRKLREIDDQNRDIVSTLSKREETIHQNNQLIEEKTRENASLTRQLENALTDARRQADSAREIYTNKERTSASRILELESQLSQLRAELARVKREKEEAERKFNSRLYDLKDRLEQSHSTNRSMQNYVQFLKNSYANVFGDTSVVGSPLKTDY